MDAYFFAVLGWALACFFGLVVSSLCRDRERIKDERDMYRDRYYEMRNERYKRNIYEVV